MKATPDLNFTVVKPEQKSLDAFVQMIRNVYQNLIQVINGQLGFGDGTNQDNINGSWINTVAPAAPNTDFTVNHNLGRVPSGYWVMQKDRACDVYTGSLAASTTQLTLRASVASSVLRLFIISLLLSLFTSRAAAQGANHTNIALKTVTVAGSAGIGGGSIIQPLSGAVITVCNGSTLPAIGATCTGLANIFSNITLTTALSNPTNADINGNYTFYAAAGTAYVISVSAFGFTTYSYVWTAPVVGASSGANTALSNLVSVSINTSLLPQTNVDLGGAANQFRNLYLFGSGTYGSNYFIDTGTPTGVRTQTKQDISDTYVYRASIDSLTNKTLVSPTSTGTDSGVETLANKTLTSPVINGPSTGTGVQGTDSKLLTSGTISGTSATLCTDANGGATTSSCSAGVSEATWTATYPPTVVNGGGTFAAVGLGNTATGAYAETILPSAHTLIRFTAYSIFPVAGCGTQPSVAFYDETAASALSTLSMNNGVALTDSGVISVPMTAGHTFSIHITVAGIGCTVGSGEAITWTAVYK